MRIRFPQRILQMARKMSWVPGLKFLLMPFYKRYVRHINNNRNNAFQKNGIRIMKEFDEIMMKNGIHYSVFAGTLLGAIREKGVLKHDMDLDTVMFNSDYSPQTQMLLEKAGFKLIHSYLIDKGARGREETYEKDDVSIDIYYVFSDEQYPTYQCDFHGIEGTFSHEESQQMYGYVLARRIEFPISYEVRRSQFENIEVNVLANAEEWLECRYGKDYMTPDPNFCDKGDNPHIFEWTDVKAEMIY